MGKINTSIASNNLSNFTFYIDLERSVNYTFPFNISTSVPGPIYARIKNTGAGTITISATQIIFFMGQPGPGADYTLTTVSPNETKYFWVSSRYLPSEKVGWNTYTNIKIGGKTSIKKQNLTNLLPYALDNFKNLYIFKGGGANTIGTVFNKDDFIKRPTSSNADRLSIFTPDLTVSANYWVNSTTNLWTRTSSGEVSTDVVILENYVIVIFAAGDPSSNLPKSINNGAIVQRYNSGKIKTNKLPNLFTCPFNINTTTCPSVGLSDSGWELGTSLNFIGTTTAPDNSNSAVIYQSTSASNSYVSQGFLQYWRPFTRYKFSIWTKLIAGEVGQGNVINVTRNGSVDRAFLPALGNLTSEWKKFTITFTTGASYNNGGYTTAFFAENFNGGTQIALWGAEMNRYD
jgi:hypothetical protein